MLAGCGNTGSEGTAQDGGAADAGSGEGQNQTANDAGAAESQGMGGDGSRVYGRDRN